MNKHIRKALAFVLSLVLVVTTFLPAISPFSLTSEAANSDALDAAKSVDWLWPVPGNYGMSRGYYSGHHAIDIVKANADIVAAESGVVYKCFNSCNHINAGQYGHENKYPDCDGRSGGAGNGIIIKHEIEHDGKTYTVYSHYAHMLKDSIPQKYRKEGAPVSKGDIIGKVGSSGRSDGPHLHFAINAGNSPWDAGGFLNVNPKSDLGATHTYTNKIIKFTPTLAYNYTIYYATELVEEQTITAINKNKHKNKPYAAGESTRTSNISDTITIVGKYTNLYNNLWYLTKEGDWIFSGHWSDVPQKTITFEATASTNKKKKKAKVANVPPTVVINEDQDFVVPNTIPELDGYTFLGWATKENATKPEYKAGDIMPHSAGNVALYPVWRQTKTTIELEKESLKLDLTDKTTVTSSVSFECKGDLSKVKEKVTVKSDNINVATVICENVDLKGFWIFDKLTGDVKITAKNPGIANIRIEVYNESNKLLIAKSIHVEATQKYDIEFYDNVDGSISEKQTKTFGKEMNLSERIPEKANYFFMGWSTDKSDNVTYLPGQAYKKDSALKLYAVWKKDNYINYSFENGVLTITGNGAMPSFPTGKTPWVLGTNGTAVNPKEVKEIIVESGITSVGTNAFANFFNLAKVILPYGITQIGNKAFYNCSDLENIQFPMSIKYYGTRAFSGCEKLLKIDLWTPKSKSVTTASEIAADVEIGAFAFENCVSLASVNLPDTVSDIGIGAFSGCSAVTEVVLPSSISEIEDTTFFGCSSLEEINIPANIDIVGDAAFSGCSAAETIVIPEGVEVIGDQAFSGCSAVTAIEVPESADEIGAGLFTNCSALNDVTLPENMEYIGDGMFSGCSALKSIEIPQTVEIIGDGAFSYCSSLEKINIPENVSVINDSAFWGCSSLTNVEIPENVVSIGDFSFSSCSNLNSVTLGEGTTDIGVGAFAFCSSLETINLPASVTLIDEGAFMDCSSLTNVEFSDSELIIEKNAFSGCSALTDVVLPEEVIYIGENAFANCSSDMNVTCFTSSSVYDNVVTANANVTAIVPVTGITISQSEADMNAGETISLTATASPANATCDNILWSSNNPSVATIDENGIVTAVSGGNAVITATTEDNAFVAECAVSVIVPVTGISMYNTELNAYSGDEFSLEYSFAPENPSDIGVEWNSSNENVATVDEDGNVTVISAGTTVITVKTNDGGFTSSCTVIAEEFVPVTAIEFENSTISMHTGNTIALSAKVVPSNATYSALEWYTDESGVVEVSEDGVVTAVKPGTANVYAYSFEGVEACCTVTVKEKEYTVTWNNDGVITEQILKENDKIVVLYVPEKEGYSFVGWTPDVPEFMPAYDMTFTAVFEKREPDKPVDPDSDKPTEPVVPAAKMAIRNPSTTSINYGDSIILHADVTGNLPAGAKIVWDTPSNSNFSVEVSADGKTCKISPVSSGSTTFTAKVIAADGKTVLSEDTQDMTSKAGFFQKIIAFFKKLFGATKVIPQAFKAIS